MNLMLAFLILAACPSAYGQAIETIDISSRFVVHEAETVSVPFKGRPYVRNLIVQARGLSSASMVEVMVNGQIKGTLYAPGSDPSYVVTVEANTASIEFRHRDGGRMEILDIMVDKGGAARPIASLDQFITQWWRDGLRSVLFAGPLDSVDKSVSARKKQTARIRVAAQRVSNQMLTSPLSSWLANIVEDSHLIDNLYLEPKVLAKYLDASSESQWSAMVQANFDGAVELESAIVDLVENDPFRAFRVPTGATSRFWLEKQPGTECHLLVRS